MKRVSVSATGLAAVILAAIPLVLVGISHAEPGDVAVPPEKVLAGDSRDDRVDDAAEVYGQFWKLPGFAQVEVDYLKERVIVRWGGEVPTEVEAARTRVPEGVEVEILSVAYSEDEILNAAERVADSGVIEEHGYRFSSAVADSDYSGLILEVVASEGRRSEDSLLKAAGEVAEVPLTVKLVKGGSFTTSRLNDSAPWQGGGLTRPSGCTIGFAVVTPNGGGKLLSAAHCNSYAANPVRDGNDDLIAPASNVRVHRPLDSLLIDPTASPATIGKVFGGPWNAGAGHGRYQFRVANANTPALGHQDICSSGAMNGEHCGMTIRETSGLFPCNSNPVVNCRGFRSSRNNTTVASGSGDSGGPIYRERSDGRVSARGVIMGGDFPLASCGQSTRAPTRCGSHVWAQGIHKLLDHWNVEIETS